MYRIITVILPLYCCFIAAVILLLRWTNSQKKNLRLQYQFCCCTVALEKETAQLLLWTSCLRKSINDIYKFTKRGVFTGPWSVIHRRIYSFHYCWIRARFKRNRISSFPCCWIRAGNYKQNSSILSHNLSITLAEFEHRSCSCFWFLFS